MVVSCAVAVAAVCPAGIRASTGLSAPSDRSRILVGIHIAIARLQRTPALAVIVSQCGGVLHRGRSKDARAVTAAAASNSS
jgi:hypothetical protein